MNQKQPGKTDTYYGSTGFYVPRTHSELNESSKRAHRHRRGCLTIVLVLILAIGSLMWYRSQASARGDVTPPALNTPFSIWHPLASMRARDAEQATWNAVSARDPTAMEHELVQEDTFFRRATTQAREWQVLLLPTPARLAPPLLGKLVVTSPFGLRQHPVIGQELEHHGVDLEAAAGTPVMAAARGVVVWRGNKLGYGNCIVIRHGTHLSSIYGHLTHIGVRTGQLIGAGEVIGLSGSTGFSTGPHLHFEVRRDGIPIDPLPLLAPARGAISLNSC
ncbi:MAG TPA: M23 family metallopeptidase [Candidatus Cryosericum sp.]|nr:M23 family metallopeptidase [Candidatus Cryosericum sp.]